jgi:hypothetical protein
MRRQHVLLLTLAVAALALLLLWPDEPDRHAFPEAAVAPPAGLRPGQTGRAQRTREARKAQVAREAEAPPPPADEGERPLKISIDLLDLSRRATNIGSIVLFRPSTWWPLPEEDPLAGSPSAALLQSVLDLREQREWEAANRAELAFMEMTREELDALDEATADEPWWLLLRAELERLHADQVWMDAMESLEHDPDEVPEWLPSQDHGPMRAAAERLLELYPEAPEGDFARLYLLEAASSLSSTGYDPGAAAALALSMLTTSSDPVVVNTAADLLSNLWQEHTLSRGELALLAREYDLQSPQDRTPGSGVAAFGMYQAFALQDWEDAERWLDRYEAEVERRQSSSQKRLEEDVADARGQLAAARGEVPTHWRSRLVAEAWRCHLESPVVGDWTYWVHGTWDGGWSWSGWQGLSPAFVRCFERVTADLAEPEATEVILILTGER